MTRAHTSRAGADRHRLPTMTLETGLHVQYDGIMSGHD